jgi:NAD(P)-dependent dehydrogenase (short-subunit alcohol dehydrogenase family)
MAESADTSNEKQVRWSALVTGASTGIGRACVDRLVNAGWRVYASVRKPGDARALDAAHGRAVTPMLFDLTDLPAIEAAGARIIAECGEAGLQGVVNNAGIAVAGPLEFLPPAELRHQLNVNVVGQVAVAQAVLPALRRGRGRIVLVGSISGRSALPFTGAYAASKFALEAIADSWRIELAPWQLRVIMVEPGVIATPIWDTAAHYANRMLETLSPQVQEYYGRALDAMRRRAARGIGGLPPTAVAAVVERALTARRPRARYVVGRDAKTRVWLQRLPTRVRDRIVLAALKRM